MRRSYQGNCGRAHKKKKKSSHHLPSPRLQAGQVSAAAQKLWAQLRGIEPYDAAGLSHSRRNRLNFASIIKNTTSLHNFKYGQKWLSFVSFSILGKSRRNKIQFSSVAQSCPILCDPMNRSMPGLPVHHQLPEFTQTHVHQVSNAIQPSHLLSSPSPPAPNPSQYQSLFQWVNSSHQVAKVLDLQL